MMSFWIGLFVAGLAVAMYGLYEKGKEVGRQERERKLDL